MTTELAGMGFALSVLLMILVLVVVLVWQWFKTVQVRTTSQVLVAGGQDHRRAIEEMLSLQRKLATDISDLRARVAAVEAMLREVG